MSDTTQPDLTRRELVGALARWTVPTVVTITLGSRSLLAMAPSCPPCTKRTAGKCKACSVSQILNCQCEPCLGPPYCTGAGPGGSSSVSAPPGLGSGPSGASQRRPGFSIPQVGGNRYYDDARLGAPPTGGTLRGYSGRDPMSVPLYREPFSTDRRYRGLGTSPFEDNSLYGRLRADTLRRAP
ncbi:MAG: hypothetical protein A2085_08265 [Gemmatimonadetes bacterium GWC2_71_10]|nr:MAG: hypothetical protein A2085_08265 [Gemmatimonadetes bacterium GWC2_71_10]